MKKIILSFTIICVCFCSGYCSIFTSKAQKITVDSEPQGAKVKIGSYKGVTPYEVWMPRGKDHVITAEYGDKQDSQSLNRSIEPIYWINILFWPGLIIDLATGSMFKYDPTDYEFDFTKTSTIAKVTAEKPPVATLVADDTKTVVNCENCGRAIGKLEMPYPYKGSVVCYECFLKLKKHK